MQSSSTGVITVNKYAQDYVLEDKEVENLDWNGREIRNAFLTAMYLARYKEVKKGADPETASFEVRKEHFKSVVRMSKSFDDYMDSINNTSEAERARHRGDRNDAGQDPGKRDLSIPFRQG